MDHAGTPTTLWPIVSHRVTQETQGLQWHFCKIYRNEKVMDCICLSYFHCTAFERDVCLCLLFECVIFSVGTGTPAPALPPRFASSGSTGSSGSCGGRGATLMPECVVGASRQMKEREREREQRRSRSNLELASGGLGHAGAVGGAGKHTMNTTVTLCMSTENEHEENNLEGSSVHDFNGKRRAGTLGSHLDNNNDHDGSRSSGNATNKPNEAPPPVSEAAHKPAMFRKPKKRKFRKKQKEQVEGKDGD